MLSWCEELTRVTCECAQVHVHAAVAVCYVLRPHEVFCFCHCCVCTWMWWKGDYCPLVMVLSPKALYKQHGILCAVKCANFQGKNVFFFCNWTGHKIM
jgi:hypothetical protein